MPLSPVRAALRDIGFFLVNCIEPAHRFLERGDFRPPTRLSPSRLVDRRREKLSGTILRHARPVPGTVALDTVWGCHQWLALGIRQDPQALLPEAERSRLAELGVVFAAFNAPHVRPGTFSLTTDDPVFLAWAWCSRASGVLVRPDRFIAAKLAPSRATACLSLLRTPSVSASPVASFPMALGEAA